jgi:S1-C subfamily serine protease
VLKVDGADVNDARLLAAAVAAKKPGDRVTIEFTRGGAAQTLDVTLGDRAGRAYLGVSPAAGRRGMPAVGRGKPFSHTLPFSGSLHFGGRLPFSGTVAVPIRVISVTAGSPAEKAGLLPGDMLLTIDDVSPDMRNSPGNMLESRKPGDVVRLAVQRGGQKLAFVATLASRPDGRAGGWLGVSYAPRMAVFDRKWHVPQPGNANRVRVTEVLAGSPAERAGLSAGDLIVQVDGGDVGDVRAFQQAVGEKNPGDTLKLMVIRGGAAREIAVTLGESPTDKTKGYMGVRLAGGPLDNFRSGNRPMPGQRDPAPQARPASNL